ncbi:MAG: DUF308 domain-containing protein [Methanobrevibacter sp.]|nr:DUF308 domain-containing protein [Methanobrevibacter sp.]
MDLEKTVSIIFMILGVIFIISPMFSAQLVSIIVGLSLLFFGIVSIVNAFSAYNMMTHISMVYLLVGFLAVIFAILFIFFIDIFSFLIGFSFYIIGFIMIAFGVIGLISESRLSKSSSLIILLVGIISILLAMFAIAKPEYVAMLIGLCLIIEGIKLYLDD